MILAASLVTGARGVSGQDDGGDLDLRVRAALDGFAGQASLYAKNLDRGTSYGRGADDRVRSASTIKLAILVAAHAEVAAGRARWDDPLVLTEAKKAPGAGVLPELEGGLRLTLRDATNLMIVVSDNTATNLVLDHLSADTVNAHLAALGFAETRCLKKIGGGGPSRASQLGPNEGFGIGVTTPHEMVDLVERLVRGTVVSAAASREMLELLKTTAVSGRDLPQPEGCGGGYQAGGPRPPAQRRGHRLHRQRPHRHGHNPRGDPGGRLRRGQPRATPALAAFRRPRPGPRGECRSLDPESPSQPNLGDGGGGAVFARTPSREAQAEMVLSRPEIVRGNREAKPQPVGGERRAAPDGAVQDEGQLLGKGLARGTDPQADPHRKHLAAQGQYEAGLGVERPPEGRTAFAPGGG